MGKDESGQSIVLLTAALLIMLVLVGLAVDVGFGFVRSSQFFRAVDSAAKAGVFDVTPGSTDTTLADQRAQQFLTVNGWPAATLVMTDSLITQDRLGFPQYSYTATWPVETYFMRLLGIDGYPVTRSATAGFYAQAEMFTPTQQKRGHLREAGQFIVGDDGCTEAGDPTTPLFKSRDPSPEPNEDYILSGGIHRYRIRIPSVYTETQSHVRIELFDPDTYNGTYSGGNFPIDHTITGDRTAGLPTEGSCSANDAEICAVSTGEELTALDQNPVWYKRVDEILSDTCGIASQGTAADVTRFELYYLDETGERNSLATYESNPGNAASTDLQWIAPPGFTIPVSTSLTAENNARVIFLDVTSVVTGTDSYSRNVFDIWAGPPAVADSLSDDVNQRNIQIADDPTTFGQQGISVYSLGRMSLQPFINPMRLIFAPIDISFGGGAMYVSVFDFDPSGTPPFSINFQIDSLSTDIFNMNGIVGGALGPNDLAAACDGGTSPGDCNGVWTLPQWGMGIPGSEGRTVFFGGNLIATYSPAGDAHTISLSLTDGRPFLAR